MKQPPKLPLPEMSSPYFQVPTSSFLYIHNLCHSLDRNKWSLWDASAILHVRYATPLALKWQAIRIQKQSSHLVAMTKKYPKNFPSIDIIVLHMVNTLVADRKRWSCRKRWASRKRWSSWWHPSTWDACCTAAPPHSWLEGNYHTSSAINCIQPFWTASH